MKTHAQKVIELTVNKLLQFYQERGEPLHGAIWGTWMSGKTRAAVKVARTNSRVKYLKFPENNVTDTQFIKQFALAIGVGPDRSFLGTFDIIVSTLEKKNIVPVVIIDEAQRLFAKKRFLSILKDLSERVDFIYLFLGDEKLSGYLHGGYHSLVKRILVRKQISPIEKETVELLLQKHGFSPEAAEVVTPVLKNGGITTGELDIALYLARKKKVEKLTKEELMFFLEAAVEGI